jgi:hypothetical protein
MQKWRLWRSSEPYITGMAWMNSEQFERSAVTLLFQLLLWTIMSPSPSPMPIVVPVICQSFPNCLTLHAMLSKWALCQDVPRNWRRWWPFSRCRSPKRAWHKHRTSKERTMNLKETHRFQGSIWICGVTDDLWWLMFPHELFRRLSRFKQS